ncbi:hypothetical protein ACXR0O_12230 [Verrucomicrobiota bacterium sgz303538]
MSESWLKLLLRILGGVCVLALIPLFVPRSWLDVGHKFLGLGEFPAAPIAEYLARSVSALCAFYGGLLLLLAVDVRRFVSIIKYQAVAIMALSAIGIFAGVRAGVPAYLVVADALGCWVFLLPILILAARFNRE